MADAQSQAPVAPAPAPPPPPSTWKRLAVPLSALALVLLLVVLASARWVRWQGASSTQVTDDAVVKSDTTRLSARVAGNINRIPVQDYQTVKAGELLLEIDSAEYEAALAQADASVAGAVATIENLDNQKALQRAVVAQAEAQRAAAHASEVQTRQELERQNSLIAGGLAGTRQKVELAVAQHEKSLADVAAIERTIEAQRRQLDVLNGQEAQLTTQLRAAQALRVNAELRLRYTRVTAPFDGVVGERQVHEGDYVNVGTNLVSVVPLPNVFVTANYKETQLTRVQPGQKVDIRVDTFPGEVLQGHVARLSPASGSTFALLPPDNATGNFTKVVQRIPVRIEFEPGQKLVAQLRPGMSVVTRIHVD
ncbi:HlyD family secretion protein [Roseiterribacter gracilis]|uniref:Multidrug resistance protein n=1 Tax=Roseiterribacter gracilis TaxID=2812848 RepID=A0A8S8XEY2_9PROT|nr:multidrug resistance protein [Rhodospirillales bacterium TMPK1]